MINKDNSKPDKMTRREALKRMGLLAGGAAFAAVGGSSLLSLLSGCSANNDAKDVRTKAEPAAYNDSFPESPYDKAEKIENKNTENSTRTNDNPGVQQKQQSAIQPKAKPATPQRGAQPQSAKPATPAPKPAPRYNDYSGLYTDA